MIDVRQEAGAVILAVKVVPGASRTRFLGELDGRAKIAVASPPEGGKANRALIALLAKLLGVRSRAISVESGVTSPLKSVRIEGARTEQVRSALGIDRP